MEDLCAGFPWKAHVQNHDIVFFRYCPGFTVVAVGDQVYAPALLLKAPFDELANGGIVFDYEDFHRPGQERELRNERRQVARCVTYIWGLPASTRQLAAQAHRLKGHTRWPAFNCPGTVPR